MEDDVQQLYARLKMAENLLELKRLHYDALDVGRRAVAAQDVALADAAAAFRFECSRIGGMMLLDGVEPPSGIEVDCWRARASLSAEKFATALTKARRAARCRAGEKDERVRRPSPSIRDSRTVVTDWRYDAAGNLVRHVVGIGAPEFDALIAAGIDAKIAERQLVNETLRSMT